MELIIKASVRLLKSWW